MSETNGKPPDDDFLPPEQLALELRYSRRWIDSLFARGMPRRADGKASVRQCKVWIRDNVPQRGRRKKTLSVDDPKLRERLLVAEISDKEAAAEAKQIKNAKVAGELVYRHEAERCLTQLCVRVKTRLEAIPDELEMLIPQEVRASIKRDLSDAIYRILKEMAAWRLG